VAVRFALVILRWKIKWRYMRPFENPTARKIFHWQFSGVIIPLCFATGVGMALAQQFGMAYIFFILSGTWCICYWLTSDVLKERKRELDSKKVKKTPVEWRLKHRSYICLKWLVTMLIIVVAGGFTFWTRDIKSSVIAEKLLAERKDAYDHLEIKPLVMAPGAPMQDFAVEVNNGGGENIGDHVVNCWTVSLWDAHHNGFEGANFSSPSSYSRGLLEGGDKETVKCMTILRMDAPVVCADIMVEIEFPVSSQPTIKMTKPFRFSGRRSKPYDEPVIWQGRAVNSSTDGCSGVS
jgi:hypothetical protein